MIRLPAPEMAFQNDQPTVMGFLSEAITADDQCAMSPFAELIICATISGRALSHRHQSSVENIYVENVCTNAYQDFWNRHQWISTTLMQRIHILSNNYVPASQQTDPMLLFTNMLAQTTVLYLYNMMRFVTPGAIENRAVCMDYQRCSLAAVEEMVTLTKTLARLGCFKARRSSATFYDP